MKKKPLRVLFVCTGNICRSPTAEAVFRARVEEAGLEDRIETDSAGTHDYHVGQPPDRRAQGAARKRGYDLSTLRARRIEPADFERFDLLLAFDEEHRLILERMAPKEARAKVGMLLDYARSTKEREVPDPYYGNAQSFERVLDLVEDAATGLVEALKPRLDQPSKR